jgi:hypothetical protein
LIDLVKIVSTFFFSFHFTFLFFIFLFFFFLCFSRVNESPGRPTQREYRGWVWGGVEVGGNKWVEKKIKEGTKRKMKKAHWTHTHKVWEKCFTGNLSILGIY